MGIGCGTPRVTQRPTQPARGIDWSSTFARYQALVLRFAAGLVGRPELAEDLVQEAFRSVFERSQAGEVVFESEVHARNYVFRAIRNLAVDALRSPEHARVQELEDAEALPARDASPTAALLEAEAHATVAQRTAVVERAIQGLRPPEREALGLRFGNGFTYREMAECTGESLSTLQGRVETALGKIRRKVGKEAGPS